MIVNKIKDIKALKDRAVLEQNYLDMFYCPPYTANTNSQIRKKMRIQLENDTINMFI